MHFSLGAYFRRPKLRLTPQMFSHYHYYGVNPCVSGREREGRNLKTERVQKGVFPQ